MKHYLTFSEPSALIEKAKWLENVGFKILDDTFEAAIRDSNPLNSLCFSTDKKREMLNSCNVGKYEVRPSFILGAEDDIPANGFLAKFEGFKVWDTKSGLSYYICCDEDGKCFLFSHSSILHFNGFKFNREKPRRFKKATEKVLDKWFNCLSDMESQLSK